MLQAEAPTMTSGSRPGSSRTRPPSRSLSQAGMAQTQDPALARSASRSPPGGAKPRYYDQQVQGMDLSGWGEITPKPFSCEVEAYKETGSYADPKRIRPAGGYGTQQWSPPPLLNTTSVGLVLRDTHTLHTQGSGVMVETVLPNSPAAWKGFRTKDVITHLNGTPCMTAQEFFELYAQAEPNSPMEMAVNRDGRRGINFVVKEKR